jgi:hypothetical protein
MNPRLHAGSKDLQRCETVTILDDGMTCVLTARIGPCGLGVDVCLGTLSPEFSMLVPIFSSGIGHALIRIAPLPPWSMYG